MKKLILFCTLACSVAISNAQIKKITSVDVAQVAETVKPYNYNRPVYDSLSNDLLSHSNIIGQRIYFAEKTRFSYLPIKCDTVNRSIRIEKFNPENKDNNYREDAIVEANVVEASYGKEVSDVYMTIIDIIELKDHRYKSHLDRLNKIIAELDNSYNVGIATTDNIYNTGLSLNESGALSIMEIRNNDPNQNRVASQFGFEEPKSLKSKLAGKLGKNKGNAQFDVRYQLVNKPLVAIKDEANINPYKKVPTKTIFILLEENTQDTLYVEDMSAGLCVGYFEKMVSLHKDKKFTTVGEGHRIENALNGYKYLELPPNKEYICKDVVLYNGKVVGVLSDGESEFGIDINDAKKLSYFDAAQYQRIEHIPSDKYYTQNNPEIYSAIDFYKKNDAYDYLWGLRSLDFVRIDEPYKDKVKAHSTEYNKKVHNENVAQRAANEKKFRDGLIAKYGDEFARKILFESVDLGMTTDMCLLAWGMPHSRRKVNNGVEIWYYTTNRWIKFANDKVVEFKD